MTIYYVKTNGSNGASGLDDTNAWATLDYALTQYAAGDTILIRKGDTISCPSKSFIITKDGMTLGSYDGGNGLDVPWFDGEQVYTVSWNGVIDVRAINVTVDGIGVKNAMRRGIYGAEGSNGITIKNCHTIWTYYSGIQVQKLSNFLIEDCIVEDAAQRRTVEGIDLRPSCFSAVTCTNGVFRRNVNLRGDGEGISCFKGCFNILFEYNYCAGARAMGYYANACVDITFRNNIAIETSAHLAIGTYAGGAGLILQNEDNNYELGLDPSIFCRNVVFENNLVSGYSLGIIVGDESSYTLYSGCKFYNNIFVDCEIGLAERCNNTTVAPGGLEFVNNIFAQCITPSVGSNTSNVIAHHNAWESIPDKHYDAATDYIGPITLARTSGWRETPGYETITAADYIPVPASAVYSAGVDTGVIADYFGNEYVAPFGMGAFEEGGVPPVVEPDSTVLNLSFRSAGTSVSNAIMSSVQHTTASAYMTTTTGSGTVYGVVTTSATPPSAANIAAGAGDSAASVQVTVAGQQGPLVFDSLVLGTSYWAHLVQDAGGYSDVLTVPFTTLLPELFSPAIELDPITGIGTLSVETTYPDATTVYSSWFAGDEVAKTVDDVKNGTGAIGSANKPAANTVTFTVPAQATNQKFFAKFVQQVD